MTSAKQSCRYSTIVSRRCTDCLNTCSTLQMSFRWWPAPACDCGCNPSWLACDTDKQSSSSHFRHGVTCYDCRSTRTLWLAWRTA